MPFSGIRPCSRHCIRPFRAGTLQTMAVFVDQWKASKPNLPDVSQLDLSVITDPSQPMRRRMEVYIRDLQYRIVKGLQSTEDKEKFLVDAWKRPEGGEGISSVIQGGDTFDKGGVNISIVHGHLPPAAIRQMSADHGNLVARTGYKVEGPDAEVTGLPFYAAGLSMVIHTRNPHCPTTHLNYRYFELTHPPTLKDGSPNPRYAHAKKDAAGTSEPVAWWFGGGADLTPMYLNEEDAQHFHAVHKAAADKHDPAFYPVWKRWCDRYFWITHRKENRGVGGVFFDDLSLGAGEPTTYMELFDGNDAAPLVRSSKKHDLESLFATVRSMGDAFVPAYVPIVQRRKSLPYTQKDLAWQEIRLGRYVEFNLVYDRGTKFGLQAGGARIESIMMSLPLHAGWQYFEPYSGPETGLARTPPGEGEEERRIMQVLREPRDWA